MLREVTSNGFRHGRQSLGVADVLGPVLYGEDDGVGVLHVMKVEVEDLIDNVLVLAVHFGPGEAREVHELEVRVLGRVDIQQDLINATSRY